MINRTKDPYQWAYYRFFSAELGWLGKVGRYVCLLGALVFAWFAVSCAQTPTRFEKISEIQPADISEVTTAAIRQFFSDHRAWVSVAGESLVDAVGVEKFYRERGYLPVWSAVIFTEAGRKFIDALEETRWDGLNPSIYHPERLAELLDQSERGKEFSYTELAEIDLLCSDAFLAAAKHLADGVSNPNAINDDWAFKPKKEPRAAAMLMAVIDRDPAGGLNHFTRQDFAYAKLKTALRLYEQLSFSNWETLPETGSQNFLPALTSKLTRLGYLAFGDDETNVGGVPSKKQIAKAIAAFQKSVGLAANGELDSETLAELNYPLEARVHQIKVNLERLRWLPRELGDEYIFVDVTGYTLSVEKNGKSQLKMRAVVGKDSKQTPTFSRPLRSVIFNPTWNIPRSIVNEDLLPKLKKNPRYAEMRGLKMFRTRRGKRVEVVSSRVNWDRVTEENFGFDVEQPPGLSNALGNIEFMFPNPFAVYIHGSTEPGQFKASERAFSHGCVRIEKPLALAEYLLKGNYDDEQIKNWSGGGQELEVAVPRSVPVHIFYRTAWVDDAGQLNFRKDIYHWDPQIWVAMSEPLSSISRAAE